MVRTSVEAEKVFMPHVSRAPSWAARETTNMSGISRIWALTKFLNSNMSQLKIVIGIALMRGKHQKKSVRLCISMLDLTRAGNTFRPYGIRTMNL